MCRAGAGNKPRMQASPPSPSPAHPCHPWPGPTAPRPHPRRTCLLVGDLHLARAQRLCHLVRRQRPVAVAVKLVKDVAQRVAVLARGDALPGQQLQAGRARGGAWWVPGPLVSGAGRAGRQLRSTLSAAGCRAVRAPKGLAHPAGKLLHALDVGQVVGLLDGVEEGSVCHLLVFVGSGHAAGADLSDARGYALEGLVTNQVGPMGKGYRARLSRFEVPGRRWRRRTCAENWGPPGMTAATRNLQAGWQEPQAVLGRCSRGCLGAVARRREAS